jgi:hypothetical protein
MDLLPKFHAAQLLNIKLQDIRAVFNSDPKRQLVLVDIFWKGRAIDLEVGDFVLVPFEMLYEGVCLVKVGRTDKGDLFEASQPGRGRFADSVSGWASFVRVSRQFYVGRSMYRHFEEVINE